MKCEVATTRNSSAIIFFLLSDGKRKDCSCNGNITYIFSMYLLPTFTPNYHWETFLNSYYYKLEHVKRLVEEIFYLGILYNVSISFFQSTFHLHGMKTFWKKWCVTNFSRFFQVSITAAFSICKPKSSIMEIWINWEPQYID